MGWKEEIQDYLSNFFGFRVDITSYSYVGGGSINETFRVVTSNGDFFVKKNSASSYPGMFEKEQSGLALLSKAKVIATPEIIGNGKGQFDSFLILRSIDPAPMNSDFWHIFGKQLSDLHKISFEKFGLDHNNYIGSLNQSNHFHNSWSDFFREERLEPQLKLARDNGLIGRDITGQFQRFYNKIDSIFPKESPSLIHGDLWSGNFMVNENGLPVLIDPAVYYGHREMDLGMSKLFGGFNPEFYTSYNDHYPLERGWQERLNYCNLYPLLVHVNLFGGSYIQSVASIIGRF